MSILEAGQQIGHYQIVAPLGAGGMAEVYSARDSHLGRMVAVKVMAPAIQFDADQVTRFRREATTLSALNHPNIVTVYDVDQAGEMVYIVMELVKGQSLRALVDAGPLAILPLVRVAMQIANGLAKAHDEGIVHRDLKPENVMVTDDGLVKVLDFGLAKPDSSPTRETTLTVTQPGMVVGTTGYMAPEQMRGGGAGFRSDQFALGLILFEMATGRHPFQRDTWLSTLAAVIADPPQPISTLNPSVPAPLVNLIERCLSKAPRERYAATRDLARELAVIEQRLSHPALVAETFPKPRRRASQKAIESIAILPFENVDNNPELEYLCDGLADSIIDRVSQTRSVRVMARSTVFRYKSSTLAAQQIGAELGVVAVLTGRLAVRPDRVAVSVELVNVADGSRIWGSQYTPPLSDLVPIEREMAAQITDALRVRLTPAQRQRLTRPKTLSTPAYDLYLRGRFLLGKRTLDTIRKAIEQFQQAIELDPGFARAYAGLADCHIVIGTGGFGVVPSREALTRAMAAANKAIELDDHLAEAHRSLGYIHLMYTWDWTAAEREFDRSMALDPTAAMTHSWFAEICTVRERFDEGVKSARRGVELEPLSINASFYLLRVLYYARRYPEVIEEGRKMIELEPSFVRINLMLAPAYQMLNRGDEALRCVDQLIGLAGATPFLLCLRGDLLARNGRDAEARAIIDQVKQVASSRYVDPFDIARVYVGLGDSDAAFEWLERAFEERSNWLIWLNVAPFSDVLRNDPRFARLVSRIGVGA